MCLIDLNQPGSTTNLGQSEHDTPDFALVAKAIFADDFQLGVPAIDQSLILRHEQSQAHAQWPGDTNRRADSKAERTISASSSQYRGRGNIAYDDGGPYRFLSTTEAPWLRSNIAIRKHTLGKSRNVVKTAI